MSIKFLSAEVIKKNNKSKSNESCFYEQHKNVIDYFNNFKRKQKKSFFLKNISNFKKRYNEDEFNFFSHTCIVSLFASIGINLIIESIYFYGFFCLFLFLIFLPLGFSLRYTNIFFKMLFYIFNIKFNDIEKKYLNVFINHKNENDFFYYLIKNTEPKEIIKNNNDIIKLSKNIHNFSGDSIFQNLIIPKLDFLLIKEQQIKEEDYLNTIHFYVKELNIKDTNVLTESVDHIEDILNTHKKQTKSINFFENKIDTLTNHNLINESNKSVVF